MPSISMRSNLTPLLLAALVSCPLVSCQSGGDRNDVLPEAETPESTVASEATSTATVETRSNVVDASAPSTPDPVVAPAQDDMQDAVGREKVRREQRTALSQKLVEQGQAELSRLDLESALESFSRALDLDSGNESAREGVRRTRGLLGDAYAGSVEQIEDEVGRAAVKRAQALLEADSWTGQGDDAVEEGRYDDAIEAYRRADLIVRYHPMIATGDLAQDLVANKLANAERLRDEAIASAEERARIEAEQERMRLERLEMERRETRLREFYDHANKAFVSEKYAEAEQWCDQILLDDPGNSAASALKRLAADARHHRADELNRRNFREQWLRTFEDLDTMDVPQVDPLKYQVDRWREVSKRKPLSHRADDETVNLEREAVLAKLDAVTLAPNFGDDSGDGTPIEGVAEYLQQVTGVNFVVTMNARDLEDEAAVRLQLNERSVRKVLDLIVEVVETDELRWKVEDGVVKFVTIDEYSGGQVLVTYGVQDLLQPIPDYPGRDINVAPSGGLIAPDEDEIEREANVLDLTTLEDLIMRTIEPDSWEEPNSLRITENGILTVNHAPSAHEQIRDLLESLREATGIMVDIQARFMKVEDNFLEDIGVDLRGLGAPGPGTAETFNDFGNSTAEDLLNDSPGRDDTVGLFFDEGGDGDIKARVENLYSQQLGNDNFQGSGGLSFQWTFLNDLQMQLVLRAVSKSERVELVTAPRILVHNTARANLSVLNQIAYVQDFDVEIAQGSSIADPVVNVIQDGVILDVRPVVSADRRFITLELRPTVAQLKRPMEERVTTLGSQNSVTIMLPEVEIQRVRTSIPIPDGGTVMLGGLKESEKQDYRSGIPILSKIPLLSALTERKGKFISNRKLLILLRASIVIPEEVAPTAAEMGLTD